ncbi:MAG: ABC transporter substrate-binding protein [Geminicoccaceae bacterium]
MTSYHRIGLGLSATLGALGLASAALAAPGIATGDTSKARIALSNSYAGNSWRQQMLKTWEAATSQAIKDGIIAEATVVNANNSAPEQAGHIQNMILEGYDAIVINAASPTALNGVIEEACNADIVVVVFDGIATAPCATKVSYDYVDMGKIEADYVAKRLDGKGNLLEIRGIAGVSVDGDISKGIHETVAEHPDLKLVGSVHGNWTQTVAQKEVAGILPTLPKIDAVVTQGGDGYGAAQAFKAAGRDIPIIIMGNRQDEMAWWKEQNTANGYETISLSSTPGVASIAFWTAQQLLAGKEGVPNFVEVPLLVFDEQQLDTWLKATPEGGVATPVYSQKWTVDLIDANAEGGELPKVPLPGEAM